MTLWQVLLRGDPVDPLLDTIAAMAPEALDVFHGEAHASLAALTREGLGTMDPIRATALVEDLRLLALASLPWKDGNRDREAEVERLTVAALARVGETEEHQRIIHEGRRLRRVRIGTGKGGGA